LAGDALPVASLLRADPQYGWDLRVVCGALTAMRHGADPYLVANLPGTDQLSYPYLPFVAWLLAPLCAAGPAGSWLAPCLFLAILVASCAAVMRGLGCSWGDTGLAALAAPGLFGAANAVIMTGNPTVLEVPLIVLAILAWDRGRHAGAAALIGGLATLKILPLVWLLAFPFLLADWRRGARAIAAGVAVFGAVLAANLIPLGAGAAEFTAQLTGAIPGQHSAIGEMSGGTRDPNLPALATALAKAAAIHHPGVPVTALALCFLLLGATLASVRSLDRSGAPAAATPLFCLTLLALSLALFRLKPYAYVTFVPLVLAACVAPGGRLRPSRLGALLLALPIAGAVAALPIIGGIVAAYFPLVALLLSLTALLAAERFFPQPSASLAPDGAPIATKSGTI
jgi:hypothetical protein